MKGIFHMLGLNLKDRQAPETESEPAGADELIPDDYKEATGDTVRLLKIMEDGPQSSDRSEGIDSDNTGSFDVSKK